MNDAEEQLEADIDACLRLMVETPVEGVARWAFWVMRELIKKRSPERVREMEQRMGITSGAHPNH